jgi:hypothetical protein
MEHGQMLAACEDRECFLARLGLSLADTARLLRVSTSGIAKAVARAERPSVHWVNNVPHYGIGQPIKREQAFSNVAGH